MVIQIELFLNVLNSLHYFIFNFEFLTIIKTFLFFWKFVKIQLVESSDQNKKREEPTPSSQTQRDPIGVGTYANPPKDPSSIGLYLAFEL